MPELVWYAGYGSNMASSRLGYYLRGGTPPGASRCYLGCRDGSDPQQSRGVWLDGGVYFTGNSPVWSGAVAFYDPSLPGRVPARAFLLHASQFSDIAAQEQGQAPGTDLDLGALLHRGALEGDGWYGRVLHLGWIGEAPMVTVTAPWRAEEVTVAAPTAAYLRLLLHGLQEGHGWSARRSAWHLADLPGVRESWRSRDVLALTRSGSGAA